MAVGAPELRTEDLELPLQQGIARELVDRQVEARAEREAVDGREPQDGEVDRRLALEEMLLELDLQLGVQADRPERGLLVEERV